MSANTTPKEDVAYYTAVRDSITKGGLTPDDQYRALACLMRRMLVKAMTGTSEESKQVKQLLHGWVNDWPDLFVPSHVSIESRFDRTTTAENAQRTHVQTISTLAQAIQGGGSSPPTEDDLLSAISDVLYAHRILILNPTMQRMSNMELGDLATFLKTKSAMVVKQNHSDVLTNFLNIVYTPLAGMEFLIDDPTAKAVAERDTIQFNSVATPPQQPPGVLQRAKAHEVMLRWAEIERNRRRFNLAEVQVVLNYLKNYASKFDRFQTSVLAIHDAYKDVIKPLHGAAVDVLTYVRFRCDRASTPRPGARRCSDRLRARVDSGNTTVAVSYNPKFDDPNGGGRSIDRLYGPFTGVFDPDKTNSDVAEGLRDELTNLLLVQKRSVLVIGYGASGAGKTSSLIYHETPNRKEDGALVQVVNGLEYAGGRRPKVELRVNEYLAGPAVFVKNKITSQALTWDRGQWSNESKETLGQILMRVVTQNRSVKPTPNNKQSSRSHVIVELRLDNGVSLFIADFAGVENRFACDDVDELLRFASQYSDPDQVIEDVKSFDVGNCDAKKVNDIYAAMSGGGNPRPLTSLAEAPTPPPRRTAKYPALNGLTPEQISSYLAALPGGFGDDTLQFAAFFGILDEHNRERLNMYDPFLKKYPDSAMDKLLKPRHDEDAPDLTKLCTLAQVTMTDGRQDTMRDTFRLLKAKAGLSEPTLSDLRKGLFKASKNKQAFDLFGLRFTYDTAQLQIQSKSNLTTALSFTNNNKGVVEFAKSWFAFRVAWFKERYKELTKLHKVCACRSYEGAFINRSLGATREMLLALVRQAVRNRPAPSPAFADQCLKQRNPNATRRRLDAIPSQCSPWLGNCQVRDDQDERTESNPDDDAMLARIRKAVPVVAVMCVVNLSSAARHPTPYIDLTGLKDIIQVLSVERNLDRIRSNVEKIDLSKAVVPPPPFVDDARKSSFDQTLKVLGEWVRYYKAQLGSVAGIAVQQMQMCNRYVAGPRGLLLKAYRQLYDVLDKSNAASAMGTLDFVDSIAKFGMDVSPCGGESALASDSFNISDM